MDSLAKALLEIEDIVFRIPTLEDGATPKQLDEAIFQVVDVLDTIYEDLKPHRQKEK